LLGVVATKLLTPAPPPIIPALQEEPIVPHGSFGVGYDVWATVHEWHMAGECTIWWYERDADGWVPCEFYLHSTDPGTDVRYHLNCRVHEEIHPGADHRSVTFEVPTVNVRLDVDRMVGTGELKITNIVGPLRDIRFIPKTN
jgi:hypothetical protein